MQPTEEEIWRDLGRFEPRLEAVVSGAWSDFAVEHQAMRWRYEMSRVQATIVQQYMVNHARQQFGDEAGVSMPVLGQQHFYLDFWHLYRIGLHLLQPDFTIANNDTTLGLDFAEGYQQLELPEGPVLVTTMYLGYLLNDTHSYMQSAHLVRPDGPAGYHWARALTPSVVAAEPVPFRGPTAPPGRRVTPRQPDVPVEAELQDGSAD